MTGYKTLAFAAALAVLGALQGLDWVSLLPNSASAAGWIVAGIGIAVGVLRSITTTPVGQAK